MDDKALFDSAMAPEPKPVDAAPAAPPPAEPPAPAPTGERPRDEQGRFVPLTEAKPVETPAAPTAAEPPAAATPQPTPTDDTAAQVPSWRVREITEARQAAERRSQEVERQNYAFQAELEQMRQQLANLQPKPEPVDFFQDPDQALRQRLDPFEQRLRDFEGRMKLSTSRAQAMVVHGPQMVGEMEQTINQAMQSNHPDMPLLARNMQASDDPVGVAMHWYRLNKVVTETGGDLTSYRQKILDDAMKDPQYQAKVLEAARTQAGAPSANGTRPNVVNLPPSLNRATGAGVSNAAASDDDMSDRALFKHAMAPTPRR
jgi:hypothetical protein